MRNAGQNPGGNNGLKPKEERKTSMLNDVKIQGRLTRDPELRRTNSGKAVCSFSIAHEPDYVPKGQEKETTFFDVVTWEQNAEYCARNLQKGRMILVDGRVQQRKYTDKNGVDRIAVEVVADHVYHMDSKPRNDTGWTAAADTAPEEPGFNLCEEEAEDGGFLPF